jgi:hypothetical protein
MSKKYTTSEKCIYCDKKADSEEHVFPRWLRDRFTGDATLEHKVNINEPVRFKRRVKDIRVVVRSVCAKCNNTWMSEIQNKAKPIIEGMLDRTNVTLSLEDARALTTWAVMSVMCLETRNERSHWLFSELERTLLYKNTDIPDLTEVWIAYWINSPGPFVEGKIGHTKDSDGHVATLGFGNVILQILHIVPKDAGKPQPKRITLDDPWEKFLIPIRYPKEQRTTFPIDGEEGFEALESRFSRSADHR